MHSPGLAALCPTTEDLILSSAASSCELAPGTYRFGNITVGSGAVLTLRGDENTGAGVTLNCTSLLVQEGGSIQSNEQVLCLRLLCTLP